MNGATEESGFSGRDCEEARQPFYLEEENWRGQTALQTDTERRRHPFHGGRDLGPFRLLRKMRVSHPYARTSTAYRSFLVLSGLVTSSSQNSWIGGLSEFLIRQLLRHYERGLQAGAFYRSCSSRIEAA